MEGNSKQLLSERIKNATNILVTVSRNPSVDELSAALGLTLMLNKMDKHATAVFSGAVPPAISFLQPEKTFEGTVDSLRDFIIALDKEKADRLRYKVEDDVVRIFITPYRTTITQNDLQFSQGDFNVELIVALGVEKKEDLDNAISAHGRILHDATVATVNANNQRSDLGSIDWSDGSASSLCEMLMSLSESLQSGILDQQISTALLTGIVAATDRFSNNHTSPKVMTMAAQLMAAGANQQLIATKLEEGHELIKPAEQKNGDGSMPMTEGTSQKVAPDDAKGEMHIDHEHQPESQPQPQPKPQTNKDEEALANELHRVAPAAPNLSVGDLQKDLAAANQEMDQAAGSSFGAKGSDWRDKNTTHEPSFGGTLNATTDAAAEEKMREERSHRNHVLLSHNSPAAHDAPSPINGAMADANEPVGVDPFAEPMHNDLSMPSYEQTPMQPHEEVPAPEPPKPEPQPEPTPEPKLEPEPQPEPAFEPPKLSEPAPSEPTLGSVSESNDHQGGTLLDLEDKVHSTQIVDENSTLSDARAAVDAALNGAPYKPERLESAGAMPFPEIHHDEPQNNGAGAPLPPPPPLPDFSTLPPLPGEQNHDQPPVGSSDPTPAPMPPQPTTPPPANDPAQFRLPGQQ